MGLRLMDKAAECPECDRLLPGAGPKYFCPCGHKFFTEDYVPPPPRESNKDRIARQGRAAWDALHGMEDPTPERIEEWLKMVPQYGCKCSDFATHYIKVNKPPYGCTQEEWVEYTWRFHDSVDVKVGDNRMSLEEAKQLWLKE